MVSCICSCCPLLIPSLNNNISPLAIPAFLNKPSALFKALLRLLPWIGIKEEFNTGIKDNIVLLSGVSGETI